MGIWGRAATKKAKGLGGGDLVPGSRGDQDRVSGSDRAPFGIDFHDAFAFQDEIELFAFLMIVALRGAAGEDARLGEALVADGGIGAVKDAANPRPILGGKGFLAGYV